MAIRSFTASVSYRNREGALLEEEIPVQAESYEAANRLVLAYVLNVLKLREFELRVVGA
jgi:hypothetical protein